MKRVAVCVSGHLRHYRKGYEAFKRCLIDPNPNWEFDFYIDTWDKADWRRDDEFFEDFMDVIHLFKPVSIRIEREKIWDTEKYMKYVQPGDVKKGTRGEHILSMYYKIKGAHDLMGEGGAWDYDLIVRWRSDIDPNEKIKLDDLELLSPKMRNVVHVAKNKSDQQEWVSDVFAVGRPLLMNQYSFLYRRMDELVEKHKIFRPEPLLYHHLRCYAEIRELTGDWKVIYE